MDKGARNGKCFLLPWLKFPRLKVSGSGAFTVLDKSQSQDNWYNGQYVSNLLGL